MSYDVDRDFRDFVRYSGDGKTPANPYPLPFGDPTSGRHIITQAILRARFGHFYDRADQMDDLFDNMQALAGETIAASEVPFFLTVATAATASINAMHQVIYITGRSTPATGGGYFVRVGAKTGVGCFQDATGAWWKPARTPGAISIINGTSTVVAKIGNTSDADYPDIDSAMPNLLPYSGVGGKIELQFVSPITKGYLFRNADFSSFILTSAIGTVPLASNFEGFPDTEGYQVPNPRNRRLNNLFGGLDCRMPTLGCIIDMGHKGDNGWYPISGVSRCVVLPGCGVINAGFCGLETRTGFVQAMGTIWSGAALNGLRAAHGAIIAAQAANCDDCAQFPTLVPEEDWDDFVQKERTAAAVDVSRGGTIHFRGGSAKRSGGTGFNARRASRAVVEAADFSDAKYYGLYVNGMSQVSGYNVKALRCGRNSDGTTNGGYAVWCRDGIISINGAELAGSGNSAAVDIRIGDSSPTNSGSIVNASRVLTTSNYDFATGNLATGKYYDEARHNINVDFFNWPTRYGIIFNAEVSGPWEIGIWTDDGSKAGKRIGNDQIMRSSVETTNAATHAAFYNPNGLVGWIRTRESQTDYVTTSDEALKSDIRAFADEMGDGLPEFVDWLRGLLVGFNWHSTRDLSPTGERSIGVIAQQVAERLPQFVDPREGEPGEAGWKPAAVDHGKLALVAALAGGGLQDEKIRALEAQNADLAARIANLEARIS